MAGAREILFESVKALERYAAGIHALSTLACAPSPQEPVLYDALGKILEWVGADAGSVVLADETGGVFHFATLRWAHQPASQITAKEKALRLFRVPLTEGIVGQVYQSREPVVLPDVSKNQAFRKDMSEAVNYHVQSLLAVPILLENRCLGVLELFNKVPRGTFSAQDMELAVGLAQQVGVILEVQRVRGGGTAPATAPAVSSSVSPSEGGMESRRIARDAQAQLEETRALLDAAMRARDQSAHRVQALTEEIEQVRALLDAATPPQQALRIVHLVEPFAFSLSPQVVLKNFGDLSARLVNAQALQLFLWEERKGCFTLAYSTGGGEGQRVTLSFKKGEGLAGYAGDRGELVQVDDVTRDDHFSKSIDEVPGVMSRSILAGPLVVQGRLVGVVEAINRKDGRPFSSEDGVALSGAGLLGAAALEKVLAHENALATATAALGLMSDLIETRGTAGGGRAERILRKVRALGAALPMPSSEQGDTDWAALLFNLWKIILPAEVLARSGDLSPKDRELLLNVPRFSSEHLSAVPILAGPARIVRHIHERWDGQGGPDKLAGDKIPLGSRLIALVEAYEGLTTGGPGRRALPTDVALKEIQACAGKQFDPVCVDLLLRLARSGKLPA